MILEIKAVEFTAELRQIKTMADMTYSVTLILPEYALDQARVMLGWLKDEVKVVMVNETI